MDGGIWSARSARQSTVHGAKAQRLVLDFFPIGAASVGLTGWPHISINTMKLVTRPTN
jgi:hypothetical protein